MKAYHDLIRYVLETGTLRPNRTGIAALSTFGAHFRHDLRDGFPLLTTKQMPFSSIMAELVGFIRGYTNAEDFRELGTKIWDANANATPSWLANPHRLGADDLGRIYGAQWRDWPGPDGVATDQLSELLHGLREDPFGRRHLVSAWNPGELDRMALPPCHVLFQCYVSNDRHLDLQMYQRSADVGLGIPFNIASYAALMTMIGEMVDLTPRHLLITFGDIHIYENHVEALREQLTRPAFPLPEATVARLGDWSDVLPTSVRVHGYEYHPPLPMTMAA